MTTLTMAATLQSFQQYLLQEEREKGTIEKYLQDAGPLPESDRRIAAKIIVGSLSSSQRPQYKAGGSLLNAIIYITLSYTGRPIAFHSVSAYTETVR